MSQSQFGGPPSENRSPYQPDEGRTARLIGYLVGGLVIGPILAFFSPVVAVTVGSEIAYADGGSSDGSFFALLVVGLLAPLLIPVPLLFWRSTRPWGVGMLIGAALTLIVLGGLCAGFIYLLSTAH